MGHFRTFSRGLFLAALLAGCAVGVEDATLDTPVSPEIDEDPPVPTNAKADSERALEQARTRAVRAPGAPATGPFSRADLDDGPVDPPVGSVQGGTRVVLTGPFTSASYAVTIGGAPCLDVTKTLDPQRNVLGISKLTCVTPAHAMREGDEEIVVVDLAKHEAHHFGTFHYNCPWVWRAGEPASCGAAPPAHRVVAEQAGGMLTLFQPGHGFTTAGAAGAPVDDDKDFVLGRQSVAFQTTGSATPAHLVSDGVFDVDFRGRLPKVWLKVEGVAHAATVEIRLGSSASDYWVFRIVQPQTQNWATDGDWVSPSLSFGGSVFGSPDRATIKHIEIVATDDGTAPVKVHVNGLGFVPETASYPKGVLSFTFDDGYASQATVAEPILTQAGFAGTAYLIKEAIELPRYLTMPQAVGLQDAGWDVGVHAFARSVHAAGYPQTSGADLEADIVNSRAWLMENGFRGFDHCAYPHGAFTGGSDVLDLARKYFTSCRTIFSTSRESTVPSDAEKLRVYLVSSTTLATEIEARIDEAVANREWIILVFHDISPGAPTTTNQYSTSGFQTIVDHAKATGIAVAPVSRVLDMP